MDQRLHALGAGVPEQAAFQQAAGQPLEVFAHQGAALLLGQLRQAQLNVAQRDAAAPAGQGMQHQAQTAPHQRLHTQWQQMQQPDPCQQQAGKPVHHHAVASAERGCL